MTRNSRFAGQLASLLALNAMFAGTVGAVSDQTAGHVPITGSGTAGEPVVPDDDIQPPSQQAGRAGNLPDVVDTGTASDKTKDANDYSSAHSNVQTDAQQQPGISGQDAGLFPGTGTAGDNATMSTDSQPENTQAAGMDRNGTR